MIRTFFLLAVSLTVASPARAASVQFQRHVLANGLTVLLHEDHAAPVVSVYTWFKVGSRDEAAGKTGFAHFFEHYMFEGSANVPAGAHFKSVFDRGGTLNAFTSNDKTVYYDIVPSESLEEILRLEADRMGFLKGGMTPQSFEKQREIVKNEKRERESSPYGGAWGQLNEMLWEDSFGYDHPVIGTYDDLNAATLQDAQAFYDTYYRPNNAVLVISGDHDSTATLAMVRKWYGDIPAGPAIARKQEPAVDGSYRLGGRREQVLTDPLVQNPMLFVVFPTPGQGQPGSMELDLAAGILGGGKTSRLYKRLVLDLGLAVSVDGWSPDLALRDMTAFDVTPRPGADLAAIEREIMAAIADFAQNGPSARELARAVAGAETATLSAMQTSDNIAQALAAGEAEHGDPVRFQAELAELRAATPAAVKAAVAAYLTADNVGVLKIVPKTDAPEGN